MKYRAILIAAFLSWVAFDRNLFRRRSSEFHRAAQEALALGEDIVRKRVRILRKDGNPVPPWIKAKARLKMKVNHFSSCSKDPRDSNQRKIRRKINNA